MSAKAKKLISWDYPEHSGLINFGPERLDPERI